MLLLGARSPEARAFYETEALRGGWTVRQLRRQIGTQFYERTALSRNKTAMLEKGARKQPTDAVTPEEELKDPLVLEFLGLKDEYSESDLEEALILRLEHFLLELGGAFAFIGRERRLRVGNARRRATRDRGANAAADRPSPLTARRLSTATVATVASSSSRGAL